MTPNPDAGRATVGGFDDVTLMVSIPPTISQSFGSASTPLNGSTSLTYSIANPATSGGAATSLGFTNTLPAGLVVATPNGLSSSCGGGAISAVAGSNVISLSSGSLPAGNSCSFAVNVTGSTTGAKSNSVTVSASTGTRAAASASLQVLSLSVAPVPTPTEWGMIILSALLMLLGAHALRTIPRGSGSRYFRN